MICNSAEDVVDEPALPAFESEEIWVQIKKLYSQIILSQIVTGMDRMQMTTR